MRAGIVVFPGINRERDLAIALERSCGRAPRMIWHRGTDLQNLDLIAIPGGFSYGDYLRCGAMAAQSPVMQAIRAHAERGGLVLGVCNGFQILVEAGIAARRAAAQRLPSVSLNGLPLARRTRGHAVHQPIPAPSGVPGADGARRRQLFCRRRNAGPAGRRGLGRAALCHADGEATEGANRNGSARNIAGILSPNLRVLGLMPHPEDLVDPLMGGTDGKPLFDSLVAAIAA